MYRLYNLKKNYFAGMQLTATVATGTATQSMNEDKQLYRTDSFRRRSNDEISLASNCRRCCTFPVSAFTVDLQHRSLP